MKESKDFVIFRLSSLGDVVLCTGVLLYWHRKYGYRFSIITKSSFASVFENHPAVDYVESLSLEDLTGAGYKKKCVELAQKYKERTLIDLHNNTRASILARYWQGDVVRYDKLSMWRRIFLWTGGRIGREKLLASNVVQRYALALEPTTELSIPDKSELSAKIFLSEQEISHAFNKKKELFDSKKPLIALHPFATHEIKSWHMDKWISFAEELNSQGYQVLWLGLGDMPGNFVGKSLVNMTTLRELCAILSVCDVLVTGDSGPMHLAQAVDTPIVAIFGPTCKEWGFYPFGENVQILQADIDCCPCSLHGSKKCSHIECLNRISSDMVLSAVQNAVQSEI